MNQAAHRGFELIWDRLPQLQNRHSSVWWFFLLFPKQAEGFGPKQIMFVFVAKVGESLSINRLWHPGLDHPPLANGSEEQFNSMILGWINDGRQMHEGIVHQPGRATLAKEGFLTSWVTQPNGEGYGGEMKASGNRPFGIEAQFAGPKGCAHFEVWGDPSSEITSPAALLDMRTIVGGSHVVAWRHLRFQGEFASPSGSEQLEGIGYFQRVCLNVRPFPWKWMWAAFADESILSGFIPYVGLQLWRHGDWFLPNFLEQATVSLTSSAYFVWGDSREKIMFNKFRVTPIVGGDYPHFDVACRSPQGDFMHFQAISYSHAQVLLDERVSLGFRQSRYNYNEYIFRIEGLKGRLSGKTIDQKSLGNGFGNCEYTWGLGK